MLLPKIVNGERRYATSSFNPNGWPEDRERCIAGVHETHGFRAPVVQCFRKRGHGPDGLYCKQHGHMVEKEQKND